MTPLGRIEIFLEVARRQSFAKAAQHLGMTGPAASKQVMALEEALGVRLLHRTTRLVTLTDEGARYYERARLALDELKDAAADIQERKAAPRGPLRISAPLSFGHMHLLPVLSAFAARYPDIRMDVALEDRKVDILAEGFDLAIRIGALEDSNLTVRQLADCPLLLAASPAYLATHGTPESPAALKSHRFITFALQGGSGEWRYKDPRGKTGSVKMEGVFRANTAEMMLQAALDGLGITLLPLFCINAALKSGDLTCLLTDYHTHPPLQISALMPPNRHRSHKVRLLLDWLEQACRTTVL